MELDLGPWKALCEEIPPEAQARAKGILDAMILGVIKVMVSANVHDRSAFVLYAAMTDDERSHVQNILIRSRGDEDDVRSVVNMADIVARKEGGNSDDN